MRQIVYMTGVKSLKLPSQAYQGFPLWGGMGGDPPHQGLVPPHQGLSPPIMIFSSPPPSELVSPPILKFFLRATRESSLYSVIFKEDNHFRAS